jgi:glucokinase
MGILGIDLGGTNVRVGFVENDELLKVESLELRKNVSADEVINDIISVIHKFDFEKVSGIGVGVPSVVDVEKGIIYDVQNIPSWKEVHLKEIFEKKFKIPVYVNNDANCFAVGEKYFGKLKGYKNAIGLIIGTGLGAGVIINDKLYSGNNCGAGEFGMIPFKDNIYEYYCCGQFFKNVHGISGAELYAKAEAGDAVALNIFAEFGQNLGEAIKTILYAIDPEIIVFGGSVRKAFSFFEAEMWKSIEKFAYAKSAERIKIEVSELEHVAILGAAALYFDAAR